MQCLVVRDRGALRLFVSGVPYNYYLLLTYLLTYRFAGAWPVHGRDMALTDSLVRSCMVAPFSQTTPCNFSRHPLRSDCLTTQTVSLSAVVALII